ncbi:MAG: DNA repair protein RecO [Pseudomonadota bacterium]|nr:DNA repair protein RecO [Pseudomonadota bacterium]
MLHRYDWSETSLIVELYTRAEGRIAVAAKGAKRPTSQLRPVLMPFQPLLAMLGKAPADEAAEIHNLRGAEWAGGAPLLDPAALFSGFYCNELLLKLLPRQDPHPLLFDAYAQTLAALAVADEAAALRAFELLLLRELGWLPDLSLATQSAAPLDAAVSYALDAEAGLVAVPLGKAGGVVGSDWIRLEAALAHFARAADTAPLRAACGPLNVALRGPLRQLLHYHLGHDTLRTRQVLQGVQRLA